MQQSRVNLKNQPSLTVSYQEGVTTSADTLVSRLGIADASDDATDVIVDSLQVEYEQKLKANGRGPWRDVESEYTTTFYLDDGDNVFEAGGDDLLLGTAENGETLALSGDTLIFIDSFDAEDVWFETVFDDGTPDPVRETATVGLFNRDRDFSDSNVVFEDDFLF